MEVTRLRADGNNRPNAGVQACRAHVAGSCEFNMIGCIRADIFFQEHYNEVGIKVQLLRCFKPYNS